MVKNVLALAAGFAVAALLGIAAMRSDAARGFFRELSRAAGSAFAETFRPGNETRLAAEIPLSGNDASSGVSAAFAESSATETSAQTALLLSRSNPAKRIPVLTKSAVPAIPPFVDAAGTGQALISEIMTGAPGNTSYEFVELANRGDAPVDLTGWSVRKKTSGGTESALVSASRLKGKIIPPHGHFLLANAGGWTGAPAPDVLWPQSYSLSAKNNSVALYNASSVEADAISWMEIPAGESFARDPEFGNQFVIENVPTPESSGK